MTRDPGTIRPRAPGGVIVESVSRSFGSRVVLDRLSFELKTGTIAAVIGPNGSGKTTLLRLLAGILAPDSGAIRVAGMPPGRGGSAFVPAGDRGLYWRLTALANLDFFAAIAAGNRSDALAAARALDAEHLLDRRMGVCSTGERRRVAIARAFAARAPVILLDEPHADLDEAGIRAVDAATHAWTVAGGTVVYACPTAGDGPPASMEIRLGTRPSVRELVG